MKDTTKTLPDSMKTPNPKLKKGVIYSGDNGRRMCLNCAGATAKYTGRDLSGMRLSAFTDADASEWLQMTGKALVCECVEYSRVAQ